MTLRRILVACSLAFMGVVIVALPILNVPFIVPFESEEHYHWRRMMWSIDESKDAEAGEFHADALSKCPNAAPFLVDRLKVTRGAGRSSAVFGVLERCGTPAMLELKADIRRETPSAKTDSGNDSILLELYALAIVFDDWEYFDLWLTLSKSEETIDSLTSIMRRRMDLLVSEKLSTDVPLLNDDLSINADFEREWRERHGRTPSPK